MHGLSTSMLLLLHSAFMLSVVKMLLKREVGGNYTIVFLNFYGNPVKTISVRSFFAEVHIK